MRLEGRTIIMRNEPPPLPLRAGFGIFGLLFAAIGTVMAFNLVQQMFRTTGGEATAWGWALGITLTILFSGAAAICLHVALRPASVPLPRAGAAARLIFLSAAQTLLTDRHGFPKS